MPHWFTASQIHCFTDSLPHRFTASQIQYLTDPLPYWLTDSLIHRFTWLPSSLWLCASVQLIMNYLEALLREPQTLQVFLVFSFIAHTWAVWVLLPVWVKSGPVGDLCRVWGVEMEMLRCFTTPLFALTFFCVWFILLFMYSIHTYHLFCMELHLKAYFKPSTILLLFCLSGWVERGRRWQPTKTRRPRPKQEGLKTLRRFLIGECHSRHWR